MDKNNNLQHNYISVVPYFFLFDGFWGYMRVIYIYIYIICWFILLHIVVSTTKVLLCITNQSYLEEQEYDDDDDYETNSVACNTSSFIPSSF